MTLRHLIVGSFLGGVSLALASDAGSWLRESVNDPKKGTTEWTVVLTTGHFGGDPQLAQATRKAAVEMLFEAGSKGDTVRAVAAEMKPWGTPQMAPIEDLANILPKAPAPGSRGGRDIERTLVELARSAKGPILVLSPGESLLPKDGRGQLMGGEGTVVGFARPVKKEIEVPTADGPRKILATLLTRDGFFTGDSPRKALPIPSALAATTGRANKPPDDDSGLFWPVAFGVGIVAVGAAYALGRSRKHPALAASDNSDLEAWKAEAKQLQRRLDLVAQDLASAAQIATATDDAEKVELRQEAARRETALSLWDEIAMDYLDGIDRVLGHGEVPPDLRRSWEQAAHQFTRLAQRAGLDVIAPAPGDQILDGQHRIERVVPPSSSAVAGTVTVLLAPGFRRGEHVLRPARIEMAGDQP